MFKNLLGVIVFLFALMPVSWAVNYTFSPSAAYTGSLEMDVYTEHQINVYHDLSDSAYISWRLIEDDYPEGWDVQLCDWQHCYSYLPFLGDMLGVGVGGSGYVRLLVNPMNIPGTGHIQFWIFPTGNMDAHVDIDFYLNTVVANVAPSTEQETTVYCNSSGQLTLKNAPTGTTNLYDMRGCLVQSWKINSNLHTETFLDKNNQIYLIQTADGKTYRLFIP